MNTVIDTASRKPLLAGTGWTLAATSFGFVVVQLDVTIVNVAMPQIGLNLQAQAGGLQWIVDAYTLAFAALLLTAGSLGDRFGSRRIFSIGLALFGLASLACAQATTIDILIVARTVQGLAAALILPTSLSLLSNACAGDAVRRAHAIGWWSAIGGVVSAAGPVAGGMLTSAMGWRSIFFVNLPICALGLWATRRRVTETTPVVARKLDVTGQVLATLALFLVTHSIIEAGSRGWGAHSVLFGFVLAFSAVAVFIVHESRVSAPMIPLGLFRSKTVSASVTLGLISNLTFYALIFVLSVYFQRVRGFTPTETGFALLPFVVIMLANVASGWLARRFSARTPVVAGNLLSAISFALLHGIDEHTPYMRFLPSLLLLAIGSGISTPSLTSSILASVDASRSATASALFGAARQVGSAMGVALFGSQLAGSPADITAAAAFAFTVSAVLRAGCSVLALLAL